MCIILSRWELRMMQSWVGRIPSSCQMVLAGYSSLDAKNPLYFSIGCPVLGLVIRKASMPVHGESEYVCLYNCSDIRIKRARQWRWIGTYWLSSRVHWRTLKPWTKYTGASMTACRSLSEHDKSWDLPRSLPLLASCPVPNALIYDL